MKDFSDLIRTAAVVGVASSSIKKLNQSYTKQRRPIKVRRGQMIGILRRE